MSYQSAKFGQGVRGQYLNSLIEFERSFFANLLNSKVYTIEFFTRETVDGKWNFYFGMDNGSTSGLVCRNDAGVFEFGNATLANFINFRLSKSASWRHYAIVSDGTTCRVFVNGTMRYSHSANVTLTMPNENFQIGGRKTIEQGAEGGILINLDEFRISDICRYTENFTPPTEPFS